MYNEQCKNTMPAQCKNEFPATAFGTHLFGLAAQNHVHVLNGQSGNLTPENTACDPREIQAVCPAQQEWNQCPPGPMLDMSCLTMAPLPNAAAQGIH